jgi:hypothetical protein
MKNKVAFIGSSKLVDNCEACSRIEEEFLKAAPDLVVLVPNALFNAFIRSLADKYSIPVDEMDPPKPTWLGRTTISEGKMRCRSLYGYYVVTRANKLICFGAKSAPGTAYRPIVEYARGQIPIVEFDF